MQEALNLVRRELGPQAAVLHTREVRGGGLLGWLSGARHIEVAASNEVNVPSRLPKREAVDHALRSEQEASAPKKPLALGEGRAKVDGTSAHPGAALDRWGRTTRDRPRRGEDSGEARGGTRSSRPADGSRP